MEPVESIGTEVLVGSEVLKTDMEPSKDESVTEEKDNPITSTANRLSDEILKENRLNEETVASQFDAAIEEQSHMLINSYASAGDGESNQIETAREVSFQPADGVGGYTSEHDVPEAVIAEFVQKGPPGSSEVREEKVAGIEESSPTKNEKMHENNELLAHEDAEATYHPVYVFDEAVDSPVSGDRGLADKAADFPAGPAESENIQADADHPVYAEGIDKNVTERGAIKAEEVTAHAESNSSAYIDIVAAHESAEVNEGEPTEIFDVVPDSVEPHQDAPVEGSETHNLNFVQEENTQLAFVETEGQQVDHEVKQVEEVGQTIDAQARTSEIPEETHKDLDKIEPALGTEIVETGESATNGHGYEDAFDSMENPVKAIPLAGEISEVPKESAAYVLQETNPMAIGDDTPDQNNAEVINKEPEPPLESMVAETGNEDQSKVEAELPGPNAHSSEVPSSESQEANLIDGSNALDLSTGENKPQPIDAAPGGE
ncbi:hypothetical protein BJ742DRAFT_820883 [Cladochytrium replicatum]|nr:hypothetical protein BJ742DRAFT_820883 [Cladochytrium replicatum]